MYSTGWLPKMQIFTVVFKNYEKSAVKELIKRTCFTYIICLQYFVQHLYIYKHAYKFIYTIYKSIYVYIYIYIYAAICQSSNLPIIDAKILIPSDLSPIMIIA